MAIGRVDRPGDELCRSHEGLERGHQPDMRGRAHELSERRFVRPDGKGPVVAGEGFGPQRVADEAVGRGELLANGRHPPEEAHGRGDPLERQVGGHHQVFRSRLHPRASCPGQVGHGSESSTLPGPVKTLAASTAVSFPIRADANAKVAGCDISTARSTRDPAHARALCSAGPGIGGTELAAAVRAGSSPGWPRCGKAATATSCKPLPPRTTWRSREPAQRPAGPGS